jgi:hypothetical protein
MFTHPQNLTDLDENWAEFAAVAVTLFGSLGVMAGFSLAIFLSASRRIKGYIYLCLKYAITVSFKILVPSSSLAGYSL